MWPTFFVKLVTLIFVRGSTVHALAHLSLCSVPSASSPHLTLLGSSCSLAMAASSCTRSLILVTVTAISVTHLLLLSTTEAQSIYNSCSDTDGNFTINDTYQSNLLVLLNSLTSTTNTTSADGFATNTTGVLPNRVYGLALCRGDATPAACGSCLDTATADIQQICPFRKSATIRYDTCYLRYSNRRFLNTMDSSTERLHMWNVNNITKGASQFNLSVRDALLELAQYAAFNGSSRPPRFAAGEMALGKDVEFQKLYGLVQCNRDFSADDCSTCLRDIIGDLPRCCSGKIGGRVLSTSCNFRYEIAPFYNWSANLTLPPLPTTPSPPALLSPPGQPSVPIPGTNNTSDGSGKKNNAAIFGITIPLAVAFTLLILIGCICFQKRKATKKKMDTERRRDISSESLFFDLSAIRNATNNFSPENKLGEGGFGAVYKGSLGSGQEIAVKRLSRSSGQGLKELKNEVLLLAKLQHRNLVRLLGLCLEDEEKLLIYEYVVNKSLDIFLFDSARKGELNWERRYNIVTGIARGLLYLHEESQVKIIHRDLKSGNVLLDGDMNPKISDFGLARLFGGDQTQACTSRVVGTFGYMSPEYAMRGHFSNKSDVFSFGVLVLEIVTGKRSNDFQQSGNATDLLCYVWDHWSSGSAPDILDPSLEGNFHLNQAMRCIEIGLLCVQESPFDRPAMSKVVLMLNSYSVSTMVPTRPLFLVGYTKEMTFGQVTSSDLSADLPEQPILGSNMYSPNEMSVTELEPR